MKSTWHMPLCKCYLLNEIACFGMSRTIARSPSVVVASFLPHIRLFFRHFQPFLVKTHFPIGCFESFWTKFGVSTRGVIVSGSTRVKVYELQFFMLVPLQFFMKITRYSITSASSNFQFRFLLQSLKLEAVSFPGGYDSIPLQGLTVKCWDLFIWG